MPRMIHSKYGYEPPEWVQADAGNLDIPDAQRQLIGIQAKAMEPYTQVLAIRIHLLEK